MSDRRLDILLKKLNLNLVVSNRESLFKFQNCIREEFLVDGRGGKRHAKFYEYFPEMETEAVNYLMQKSSAKDNSFNLQNFALFLTKKYQELYPSEVVDDGYVRSTESLRLDMKDWGFVYEEANKHPYWEGHERADVVEKRTEFINYFIERSHHYYIPDELTHPKWINPTEKPCILMFHDESTFRSGEIPKNILQRKGFEKFTSKGLGKSIMVSDFIVSGKECFFHLSPEEWSNAVAEFPDLIDKTLLDFVPNTATASIRPGQDGYMDNKSVLLQFERLFKMLKHKKEYMSPVAHTIEIVVDNARTHTALLVNIDDFGFVNITKI